MSALSDSLKGKGLDAEKAEDFISDSYCCAGIYSSSKNDFSTQSSLLVIVI